MRQPFSMRVVDLVSLGQLLDQKKSRISDDGYFKKKTTKKHKSPL